MCRPVALSSQMPTDGIRNLSTVASVPVQPQTPIQYRPAQSMPPSIRVIGIEWRIFDGDLVLVTITPEVTSKTKCKHIMKCLIEQYKASHLGNHGFAYDGNKSAFAAGPLPFKNKEFVIVVPEKDRHDSSSQLLRVTNMYNPQETIQALDIALKEVASHELSAWQVVSTCCRDSVKSASNRNGAYSVLVYMSNAHQAETGQSFIEEQALEIGSRKSVHKLFGSYDLLDLIKSFQIGRQKKIQICWRIGPSLLKGRFLRFVQDKKSTSVPVQERHRVLDYERVQLLPQTETVERSGQYHDGSDDRSQETHHFNLSQQTLELESDYDTAELRELTDQKNSPSNLLQNGFGLRLDELLRSHVERQEQASQSEQQESVFENDGVSQAVQSAKGALSSPPAIPQLSRTEREIINGLRIDMVRLQEQMNSLQSTLETCMKMQHELQRSVQQEVWSALSRLSTSGEDSLETCFLCCDNSSYDFSSDRCGRVHVCSNYAKKINWLKLKESVRHP
ncbi:argonaute 1-like protein [Tanacetum coccineum]|uniref:Argonaute 1-like protein n=1 Tax=Tanacetum coccineum TaxID=301880 RepID=A0ABQ4X3A0_9ASTR